jgi:TDG/mug DNA glycosylase family protein
LSSRPTIEQSELSKAEQVSGVSTLLNKISKFHPRIVCFVGLGIADIVKSDLSLPKRGKNAAKAKAEVGLQPYKAVHPRTIASTADVFETLFFAVSSTSGRVVRYQKSDKVQQFKYLQRVLSQIKDKTFDSSGLTSILLPNVPSGP